jgi:hypothetical protein
MVGSYRILTPGKKLAFGGYCMSFVKLILVTDVSFKYFEIKLRRKYLDKGECK